MGGTSGVYPVPTHSRLAAIDAAAVVPATMAALFDWNPPDVAHHCPQVSHHVGDRCVARVRSLANRNQSIAVLFSRQVAQSRKWKVESLNEHPFRYGTVIKFDSRLLCHLSIHVRGSVPVRMADE